MFAQFSTIDLIGMLVSFVLTILVLLYAFDDNALFRLAVYIFIGVAAGYAGAIALKDVLLPRLLNLSNTQMLIVVLWIVLMAMKLTPRTAKLGNPAAGLLVGVGAAVAIGGAIQGTLIPQVSSAGDIFAPSLMRQSQAGGMLLLIVRGTLVLVGTISTLGYFHFSAKHTPNQIPQRNRIIEIVSKIGEIFIAITFGVIFAGVYMAALTALVERFHFISELIRTFIPGI